MGGGAAALRIADCGIGVRCSAFDVQSPSPKFSVVSRRGVFYRRGHATATRAGDLCGGGIPGRRFARSVALLAHPILRVRISPAGRQSLSSVRRPLAARAGVAGDLAAAAEPRRNLAPGRGTRLARGPGREIRGRFCPRLYFAGRGGLRGRSRRGAHIRTAPHGRRDRPQTAGRGARRPWWWPCSRKCCFGGRFSGD